MDSQTEKLTISDVVKEMFSELHCVENGTLSQNGSATADIAVGQVLEDDSGDYVIVATGTNANGVLLTHVPVADHVAGDVTVSILKRGPATVDADRLTIVSGQETTAKAALLALGIVSVDEPDELEEGLDS
jgi:hypothetical protein